MAFRGDGKQVVSGSADGAVKVWDATTGQETLTLHGHGGEVRSAAFRGDGKQVAVLTPTTILCFQHFETFKERFAAFPVKIAMLSRFVGPKDQKAVLAEAEAGRVHIIVGTHRLLSKDMLFQDLGLMIVDEEQRFGVAHKERLKQIKTQVDVLTMTATPIPAAPAR